MNLECFCGGVRIATTRKPEFVNACNCDLCRKAGARWGYFEPREVSVEGQSTSYRRADKEEPAVEVHFCPQCGSTTHFRLTEAARARFGDSTIGVNVALAEEAQLAGVELRFPDGKVWSGVGEFGYVRESRILGDSS